MNSHKDDQETPSISSAMAKTTTISTIAVQSGKTRIVIALLHCGNWLQLKILEITPELTKLGATLAEALELQKAHDEVLRQLQNKQSPVEELLRQADQLIATQKPRAEVYAAMAETLGRAWRDINFNLELRRNILELNVQYHSKAGDFFDKIKLLEESCTDTVIPIEIRAVKEFLTNIHDMRRSLLESLMTALQSGNLLLGKIKELGAEGTLDSRPDNIRQAVNKALSQVQSWMDELHLKRQDVEATFNRRKLQLEQCLALAILAADLRELEETVINCRNRLVNADQLGDSTSSAELLQHENQKLLPEAQILQEKALKITKATEQLLASGCFAGEEATKQSYAVLSMTSDYLTEVQNRNMLLERVVEFFKSTQLAFNKLDQLEIQLSTSNLKSTSPQLAQLHGECAKAIEEITIGPIAEGYAILNMTERGSTGTEGVRRTIEDLENIKIRLNSLCIAHKEENMRINRALENFFESYTSIQTWLTSIAEAFLQEHQDMGNDLPTAKEFMNLHNKLLADLQDKGNEINALLLTLPPILEYLDDDKRKDVDSKVEDLHEKWMKLKNILENRLDLGRIYVKFHTEADIVWREIDKLENELKLKGEDIDDDSLKNLEIKWESLEPLYQSAKNTGLTFINDARKVFEPHLDTNRACLCVDAVLERLAGRQLQVTRSWQAFYTEVVEKKELQLKIEETIMESTKTINWVTKLEAQLYPIITINSNNPKEIASFIENKLQTIVPDIKRAQNEVEQKIKTAETLLLKAQTKDERAISVKNKLCDLNEKLIGITSEYQILLQSLISYFNTLSDLDKTADKVCGQIQNLTTVDDINQIRSLISDHEAANHTMLEMFKFAQNDCDKLTQRIMKQEPPVAADYDIEKLSHILTLRKAAWENDSQEKRDFLEKQHTFCRFDEDLKNINRSISNLENQNQELKSRYGKSLEEAKASSAAYNSFERTIQDLDRKIDEFINYGKNLMTEQYSHSPLIEKHIYQLQERWNNFKKQIQQTRHLIDLSIQYFQLVNEADDWFKEGSRLLVSIARRSTHVKKPSEAEELLNEIATFLKPGEEKQNERIRDITRLAEQIYGPGLSEHLSQVVDDNREMIKSFSIIKEELDTLSKNLLHAEQEKIRLQKEQEEAAAAARAAEEARAAAELERKIAEEAARKAELEALEKQKEAERAKRAEEERQRLLREQAEREKRAEEERLRLLREQAEREKRAEEEKLRLLKEQTERERRAEEEQLRLLREQAEKERKAEEEQLRLLREQAEKERIAEEEKLRVLREQVIIQQREIESRTHIIHIQQEQKQPTSQSVTIEEIQILKSPVFVTPLADAVIQEGSKFSFVCQVSGTPTPVVTWCKAGVPIQNNPDYQTSFDRGVCTLTIEETFSDDSARYTCKATNAAGSAETGAFLSVKETEPDEQLIPPSFSRLLEPACIKEGVSFQFNCKVYGNPLPNVQWYKNQECIDYSPGYHITYNNGEAILKFECIDLKDKAEYTCKAINQLGSAQSTASLSVIPAIPAQPPKIISPLSNVMARAGQKIKLECEVTGMPTPNIVWSQNGHQVTETRELKLQREGDKAGLVIHEAFLKDAGTYSITATNIAGEASSSCSVSVKGRLPNETSDSEIASDMEPVKPSIQLPLVDITIDEGSRVRLDCVIIGQPEPEVIWYHDGRPVKESTDFQLLFQGDRCSLVIQEAFGEDAGEYKVVALNSAGEASSKCKLTVKPVPQDVTISKDQEERTIPIGFAPKFNKLLADVLVSEGEKVIFEGNVSGVPKPTVKWLLNNLPITLDEHSEVVHDEEGNISLLIKKVKPEDKGVYTVKAINEHGEAKCFAQLIVKSSKISESVKHEEVKSPPLFTEIFNDKTAFENTFTKFECIVNSKPKPKIKWLFKGEPITGNNNFLVSTSGDRQVLSIPKVSKETEGAITCVAENEVGTATCSAVLTVHSLSPITLPERMDHIDSSFSMKREIHTQSSTMMSSKVMSSSSSSDIQEPQTKIHSYSSHDERTFKQVNQQTPEISESHNVEEYLKLGDKEPIIHEKSSSTFSTEKSPTQIQTVQHALLQKPIIRSRAPKFITPIIGKIVDQNTVVVLEGIVDGQPSPTITWNKNGKELVSSDKITIKFEFNKASLEIKDTTNTDAGRYTCTATNEGGTAISTADLVVRKTIFPPVFGRRLQAQVIKKNDRIVMEVEVTGTPEPTVTWFKDSIPIEQALNDNYKIKSMGNSHCLIIEKAELRHSGRFMVRAVNSGGEAQSIADIAVFEPTPDTMVEVVKTVVFEDVRKHETLPSDAVKISSTVDSKPESLLAIHTPRPPLPLTPIQTDKTIFESGFSSSTKSEFSTFSEQQTSQQITKTRLEYTAPEIPHPKPICPERIEKKMDFEIVDLSPKPDLRDEHKEELEEGIQTQSITKESSLQYFVKKIEESKDSEKELSPPKKLDAYKKYEPKPSKVEYEIPITMEKVNKPQPPMYKKIEPPVRIFESTTSSQSLDYELKPEPPAEICFVEPVSKTVETKTESIKQSFFEVPEIPKPPPLLPLIQPPAPLIVQDYRTEEKSYSSRQERTFESSSFSTNYEKQSRAISPRPEAIEMEKLWAPKREIDRPLSVNEIHITEKPEAFRSYSSMSGREIITETPRIHYVANVSHCIQPCEKKIENLISESHYEEFHQAGSKSEYVVEEHNLKPHQVMSKSWSPAQKPEPLLTFSKPSTMESLKYIRPVSVQDITNEVILEPGPPPIMDYAEPPKVRRQSYVETVEHELETKIESIPSKVPPGGVRTIPPPPPPKIVQPPPLPPKKELPIAPPIPAKPIPKKIIVIEPSPVEKFPDLEPFPFKPDPEKPKTAKTGPPPTPSKFIKGRFTDSDYESDFESARIPAKWKPCVSDNEEPSFRKVRPPKFEESHRSKSTEPAPIPPSKFDQVPKFQGPPRPEVKFEEKKTSQQITHQFVKHEEVKTEPELLIKPGTPPLYIEAPQKKLDSPKVKRKSFIDGYMADTDEPFLQQKSTKSETHEVGSNFSRYEYKSENLIESSQKFVSGPPITPKIPHFKKQPTPITAVKKELTATPIIRRISTEKHDEIYEKQSKQEHSSYIQQQQMTARTVKCPPPPSPSKFVKGEFRESDYESDYDKPIHKIWKPNGPDDTPNYRPIRPILTSPGRHVQIGRTPTPPTEFEEPPKVGGPLRPKFEPIDKPKTTVSLQEITKPELFKPKAISASQTTDMAKYSSLRPGSPPEIAYAAQPKTTQIYRSTTSMPYHNAIQTETSNVVHFKESNEKCHRTMSVEQSTKVIKFGEKQTGVKIEPYYESSSLKIKGPPPSMPKKFIPGDFRESDYESDADNIKFRSKWAPSGSDTEDVHFRSVRPPSSASRSSSVPPSKERVLTPMEFDKFPDVTDSETKRVESTNKFSSTSSKNMFSSRSRSYEPPIKKIEAQPGSPPEYGYISKTNLKSKATSIASHHMDNMTQAFRSKTQEFVRDIMSDVENKSTPKKSILKNGEDKDAQVYREESRAAQYGTKHIDPDTGLIYFKYDFGYEFGIVLPGESKNGGIPVPQKTIIEPPKRTEDIEMPVYHETTNKTQNSYNYSKPKTHKPVNKNIKWEPTSESELSEYEGNAKRLSKGSRWETSSCSPVSLSPSLPSTSPAFNYSFAGSDRQKMTDTPPSCPETPVNAQRGYTGQIRAPMFITPLRNIAVVSGQNAKFECIVQSEPPPSVLWSKNGRIIEDSHDYQLHYRNGVCRLTISRAYPEDAGTYTCTATNPAGNASTTAILDVPGEIRSSYIK